MDLNCFEKILSNRNINCTKDSSFDQTLHNEMLYKAYKNKLKALIRKSEIDYYQNMFSDRKNNIKDMWEHLGFFLNPNKNNSQNKKSVSKLNINGKTITEDKNIANTFNEYFANVGSKLASKQNCSRSTLKVV